MFIIYRNSVFSKKSKFLYYSGHSEVKKLSSLFIYYLKLVRNISEKTRKPFGSFSEAFGNELPNGQNSSFFDIKISWERCDVNTNVPKFFLFTVNACH